MSKAATKKSDKVKEALGAVQVFAQTGRLPIRSAVPEYLGPGIPPKIHPGIVLKFDDAGVCSLDPVRDAETIKAFREWMADGSDPRILELNVMEVATNIAPPFPKWDTTNPAKLPEMVTDLGLNVEHCLKYEMTKDEPRKPLVKALEKLLDEPQPEDELSEPVL